MYYEFTHAYYSLYTSVQMSIRLNDDREDGGVEEVQKWKKGREGRRE